MILVKVGSAYYCHARGLPFSSQYGCFSLANSGATFHLIRSVICLHSIFENAFDELEDLNLGLCFRCTWWFRFKV